MEQIAQEILRFIPRNAAKVVEFSHNLASLEKDYLRFNPHCQYQQTNTTESISHETNSIDCLIYRNTLETLAEPWDELKEHLPYLKEDGAFLACIPNAGHWKVIRNLLKQKWDVAPHDMRFFTLDSIQSLLKEIGLKYWEIMPQYMDVEPEEIKKLLPLATRLGIDQKTFIKQTKASHYLIRAAKKKPINMYLHTSSVDPFAGVNDVRMVLPNAYLDTIVGCKTNHMIMRLDAPKIFHEVKCFINHRVLFREKTKNLEHIRYLMDRDYILIIDFDDLPDKWPEAIHDDYLLFSACHAVQTTNERMAEFFRQYNPHVKVFSNNIGALPPLKKNHRQQHRINIFFGALNRVDDWKPYIETLNKVIKRHKKKLSFDVVHDNAFFQALNTTAKTFHSTCDYETYGNILQKSDICFMPLQENTFNYYKSDLKLVEAAAHGSIALVSDHVVYSETAKDKKEAVFFNSATALEEKLEWLIKNKKTHQTIKKNAYEYVKNHRLLSQQYEARYQWYIELYERREELTKNLLKRVPEI